MPDSNIIQIDQNLFETKLDRLDNARILAHFRIPALT